MSLNAMLLCAIHRCGCPKTAAELHDEAVGLAMSADWPRTQWAVWSAQKAAAALRSMENGGLVERCGSVKVEGNARDLWRPVGVLERWENPSYPIPDAPGRGPAKHELEIMTREQQLTSWDVLQDVVYGAVQMRRTLGATGPDEIALRLHGILAMFDDVLARAKRRLLAAAIVTQDAD